MVPVPPAVSRLSSWAIVPDRVTVPVPLPPVMVTPLLPATTVMVPSPTLSVAVAPAPASSTSLTPKPVPCSARLVCSLTASGPAGAATSGASLTAVRLIVTLPVPSSVVGVPLTPGSMPVLPASLTVTVNVVLAEGVSELLR